MRRRVPISNNSSAPTIFEVLLLEIAVVMILQAANLTMPTAEEA